MGLLMQGHVIRWLRSLGSSNAKIQVVVVVGVGVALVHVHVYAHMYVRIRGCVWTDASKYANFNDKLNCSWHLVSADRTSPFQAGERTVDSGIC